MLTLVGSCALQRLLPADVQLGRVPKDVDFIGAIDDVTAYLKASAAKSAYPTHNGDKYLAEIGGRMVEFEVAWPGSSAEEFMHLAAEEGRADRSGVVLPSLDLLYALKMTHRFRKDSPHFRKTRADALLMRRLGAAVKRGHSAWFARREAEALPKHPSLMRPKDQFFDPNEGIDYVYDHDSVHVAMKHLEMPAYTYFKTAEVWCSRTLFEAAPRDVQLYSVLEETQVLALERSQVPFPGTDPRRSFDLAHEKVCTSITSGWWRDFAWEEYDTVQAMYEDDYVDRFKTKVADGTVIRNLQED